MEEKIIVRSEQYNVKKFFKIMLIIGAVLSLLVAVETFNGVSRRFEWYAEDYEEHQAEGDCGYYYDEGELCYSCIRYESGVFYCWLNEMTWVAALGPIVLFFIIGGLIYLWLRSYEMVVTDKRVYGSVAWGKRVDLPLDSISSTAIGGIKGIAVATSSGKIKFLMIKNAAEIFEKVNALLIERQKTKNAEASASATVVQSDEMDKIKKLKELLDLGVITQEEFDTKKKDLLGL